MTTVLTGGGDAARTHHTRQKFDNQNSLMIGLLMPAVTVLYES